MLNRPVYVVGVGIHRFGKHGVSRRDMAFTAGVGAMDDAGIDFRQIGYLYNGYIGGSMMEGVTFAKDFGLTVNRRGDAGLDRQSDAGLQKLSGCGGVRA
jgi:acetyl-CoA acetyltransferase